MYELSIGQESLLSCFGFVFHESGNCRICLPFTVVVRYLTKRYIGEYSSNGDFLYQHRVSFDGVTSEVEVLDTCGCAKRGCLAEHLRWGDAFAVVYSVCDRRSFLAAAELLALLERTRLPGCAAVTLLGNKRDLEHARVVKTEEGQEMSLRFGCQFYEVSAAESCAGAALAFHALLREARALAMLLPSPRRKLAAYSVSKVIGTILGLSNKSVRKKRPSLSI
ncbi:unnamed protein product [Euphydryas editha]|uniref:small monomeric GTPase n=1 Tax=Euphydryas editha TaxID=104508 RepID=A0AAU9V2R2_EUPED|nr:unnamed protein product [Euphydryas editha]